MTKQQESFPLRQLTKRQQDEWFFFSKGGDWKPAEVVPLKHLRDIKQEYDAAFSFISAKDFPGFTRHWDDAQPRKVINISVNRLSTSRVIQNKLRQHVCQWINQFYIKPPLDKYGDILPKELSTKTVHLFKLLDPERAGRKKFPVEEVVRDARAFLNQNVNLRIVRYRGKERKHYGPLPKAMHEWYKDKGHLVSAATIRRRLEEAEELGVFDLRSEFPGFYHRIAGKTR